MAPSSMVVWIVGSLAFAGLVVVLVREMNKVHFVKNEVNVFE